MSEAYILKFDRKAFNRGVEDAFTLRPLREAVSSALSRGSSPTSKGKDIVAKTQGPNQTRGYTGGKSPDKR
jgi:hypothetical protein